MPELVPWDGVLDDDDEDELEDPDERGRSWEYLAPEPVVHDGDLGDDGLLVPGAQQMSDVERALAAQKLVVAGYTWRQIAEELGYRSGGTAQIIVDQWRQRQALQLSTERRVQILELELERLETLKQSYWASALAGDVKHAEFVLKAIAQTSRMLVLEEISTKRVASGQRTIIVASTPAEYTNALSAIVEADQT